MSQILTEDPPGVSVGKNSQTLFYKPIKSTREFFMRVSIGLSVNRQERVIFTVNRQKSSYQLAVKTISRSLDFSCLSWTLPGNVPKNTYFMGFSSETFYGGKILLFY